MYYLLTSYTQSNAYAMSAMSEMSATKFTDLLSELIKKEIETTLVRFRGKICKDLETDEDDIDIDISKFAQNTVKKIVESQDYNNIVEKVYKKDDDKKKEKKDPEAPKGPKNAFIFFCNDRRSEIKEENPDMKPTEITKKIGEMWKQVDSIEKAQYQEMAEEDKKRYSDQLESYEPKDGFKNPKSPKKNKKEENPSPKRTRSAYIYFCTEKRGEVKKSKPSISNTDILSELGKMWKTLNDKKKKPFIDMANKDKKRYEEEMKNYVPSDNKQNKVKKVKKESNRTPSAYILFCKNKRQEVKSSNPDLKTTEITSKLGKMWSSLDEKTKKNYKDQAEKLKNEKKKVEKEDVEENDDEEEVDEEDDNEEDESILSDDEEEEEIKPTKKTKSAKKN